MSEKHNAACVPRRAHPKAGCGAGVRRRPAIAMPDRYRNRPSRIRVAIYRVWENADTLGLTRSAVAVLQAIIAAGVRVDNPYEWIFAKKSRLASLADVSEPTVYRTLKTLQVDGWIIRQDQERLHDGSMDMSNIAITEKLALLLGLVVRNTVHKPVLDDVDVQLPADMDTHSRIDADPAQNNSGQGEKNSPSITMEDTETPSEMIDDLIAGIYINQRVYQKASVKYQSTPAKFVRMEGRSVPVELVWLITENRLTYSQLFSLMTKAGQVPGQQLSDYVEYRSDRIRQLATTNDCYRYLRNLIEQEVDAKYLCKQRAKKEHERKRQEQKAQAAKSREQWLRVRDGQTYVDPATNRTYTINANHGLAIVGEGGRPTASPSIRLTGAFLRKIESGAFQRFVPATEPWSPEKAKTYIAGLHQILNAGRSREAQIAS